MTLSLNDPGTDRLARAVTSQLGESLTEAVRMALAEHLEPERRRRGKGDLAGRLLEIGAECAAAPELDPRLADEILGCGEDGPVTDSRSSRPAVIVSD